MSHVSLCRQDKQPTQNLWPPSRASPSPDTNCQKIWNLWHFNTLTQTQSLAWLAMLLSVCLVKMLKPQRFQILWQPVAMYKLRFWCTANLCCQKDTSNQEFDKNTLLTHESPPFLFWASSALLVLFPGWLWPGELFFFHQLTSIFIYMLPSWYWYILAVFTYSLRCLPIPKKYTYNRLLKTVM